MSICIVYFDQCRSFNIYSVLCKSFNIRSYMNLKYLTPIVWKDTLVYLNKNILS